MKPYTLAGVVTLSAFLATTMFVAPGLARNKDEATETRDLSVFSKIVIKGSADVNVEVGGAQNVAVTTESDYLARVETEVRNKTLYISQEGKRWRNVDVTLDVKVPTLNGVKVQGSGDFDITNLDSDAFDVTIKGSGDVNVSGNSNSYDVEIDGSGDVTLSGGCSSMVVDINGSGDVDAKDLKCEEVDLTVDGSGDTDVYASKSLIVDMEGSGDVTIYGDPDRFRPRMHGSGDFEFVDDFFAAQPARPIERKTDHWSAYGWVELDLNELNWIPQSLGDWTISAEARYVRETHKLSGPTPTAGMTMGDFILCGPNQSCVALAVPLDFTPDALVPGPGAPDGFTLESFKRTDDFVTPKVALEWRPSDDTLVYASYTLAKKPGGFSTLGLRSVGLDPNSNGLPDETEFGTEKMHVYELGAKTSWFDNTLNLNGTLFYQDFAEKQAITTEVIGGVLSQVYTNDAEASVFGIELDATWQPDEHWSFSGYYTFLDGEYDDLSGLTSNPNTIAASGCDEVVGLSTAPMTYQCLVDRSGNKLEGAPKHAFVGLANYTAPFIWGNIDWFVEGDGRYQGKRFLSADNIVQLDSYFEVNIRIGLKSKHWNILAFADNIVDSDTVKSAYINSDLVNTAVFREGANATESVSSPKLVNGVVANLPDPFRYGVRAAIHF